MRDFKDIDNKNKLQKESHLSNASGTSSYSHAFFRQNLRNPEARLGATEAEVACFAFHLLTLFLASETASELVYRFAAFTDRASTIDCGRGDCLLKLISQNTNRVSHLIANLGLVDFQLGCSTILQRQKVGK